MVGVPANLGDTSEDSEYLRLKLRARNIVVQIFYPIKNDRLYFRISAAVYNTIEEFAILRDAVLEIAKEKALH